MDDCDVKEDTFLRRWLDYLSFALSGLLADGTICAAVSYTLGDLHRENSLLDYPVGGSGAVCESLVKSIERNGGRVLLQTRVDKIVMEGGRAAGVLLKGGEKIMASHSVRARARARIPLHRRLPSLMCKGYELVVRAEIRLRKARIIRI